MGPRLLAKRKALKLTQAQLAQKAKCSRGMISLWERDLSTGIEADHLFRLADALGVRARWLLLGLGPERPQLRGDTSEVAGLYDALHPTDKMAARRFVEALTANPTPGDDSVSHFPRHR